MPVQFCNVILLDAKDSLVVKATFTDVNGKYKLNEIDSGRYLIKTQLMGYEEYFTKPFEIDSVNLSINLNIVVSTELLKEGH